MGKRTQERGKGGITVVEREGKRGFGERRRYCVREREVS